MGFTKLDESILQSSIMHEDGNTFKVWIILLAASKEDGIARVSAVYISSISGIDINTVDKCLEKLSAPDNHSRSINDDGRRIERVDGGFRIINYQKYRNYTYSSAKEAIKKRKQRDQKTNNMWTGKGTEGGHVPKSGDISASASASASASEYINLSLYLKGRILERRQQKITDAILHSWGNTVRLMVEQDHRTLKDIKILIDECHNMQPTPSGFTWRDQIRSMDTLRQQWNEGKIWLGMATLPQLTPQQQGKTYARI